MARVRFAPALQRHVACPPALATGGTVREVLDAVFAGSWTAVSHNLPPVYCVRLVKG
jgi:hypothetical protein